MKNCKPEITDGVPMCSNDKCPAYDGKRCEFLGCRPDRVCLPAVRNIFGTLTHISFGTICEDIKETWDRKLLECHEQKKDRSLWCARCLAKIVIQELSSNK